jgi:hypothetical protein
MSPKEKAVEIYWKYYQLVADGFYPELNAKKCALIAVQEIINSGKDVDQFSDSYWLQVKQEIEKL